MQHWLCHGHGEALAVGVSHLRRTQLWNFRNPELESIPLYSGIIHSLDYSYSYILGAWEKSDDPPIDSGSGSSKSDQRPRPTILFSFSCFCFCILDKCSRVKLTILDCSNLQVPIEIPIYQRQVTDEVRNGPKRGRAVAHLQ